MMNGYGYINTGLNDDAAKFNKASYLEFHSGPNEPT